MVKAKPAISVRNITKVFGTRTVLDNVTLDIHVGETFVIMGGSRDRGRRWRFAAPRPAG